MKKKILLTGSEGFIGKSLFELMDGDQYDIIPLSKHDYDLTDSDQVAEIFDRYKNIDFVIHCAITGGRRTDFDGPKTFYQNTKMFDNIIHYKDEYEVLITFGSGAEFIGENNFPLNYYGLSKKYINEKIKQLELNCVNLRLWGCFGKHESQTGLIKSNLIRYKNKHPMSISSNKKMDFYYINDVIPILEEVFRIQYYGAENITYNKHYSLKDICDYINTLDAHKVEIKIDDKIENDYVNEGTHQYIVEDNLFKGIKEMYGNL